MLRCESFRNFSIASYGIATPQLQAGRSLPCTVLSTACTQPGREQTHIRSNIIHVGENLFFVYFCRSVYRTDTVRKTCPVLASMYVLQPGSRRILKITDLPWVTDMSPGISLLPAVHANISLFSPWDFHGDRFSCLSKLAVASPSRFMDFFSYLDASCALLVIVMTDK